MSLRIRDKNPNNNKIKSKRTDSENDMSSNKEYSEEQGKKAFYIGVNSHRKSHSLFSKSESKRAAVTNSKNSSINTSTKNSKLKTNRNPNLNKEGRVSRLQHAFNYILYFSKNYRK